MPTTLLKNGYAIKTTEFELRCLDQHGDAQDVHHYETKGDALTAAKALEGSKEYPAWVVEKHVSRRPAHLSTKPDEYTTIATGGSRDALLDGGWVS